MIVAHILECRACGHVWEGPAEGRAALAVLKGLCPQCGRKSVALCGHRHAEIQAIHLACRTCGARESVPYEDPAQLVERLRTPHPGCGGRFLVVERR